jgi:hypothetical protein
MDLHGDSLHRCINDGDACDCLLWKLVVCRCSLKSHSEPNMKKAKKPRGSKFHDFIDNKVLYYDLWWCQIKAQ